MAKLIEKNKKNWLKKLEEAFSDLDQCENIDLEHTAYHLTEKKVKLPLKEYPIQLIVGKSQKVLHIYPERPIAESLMKESAGDYIIFDPCDYYRDISGFFRVKNGDELILGKEDEDQPCLINLPYNISERHLKIANKNGLLSFKSLAKTGGCCIAPLLKKKEQLQIAKWRSAKLKRLRNIYGGPIQSLDPDEALNVLKAVNDLTSPDGWRKKDKNGDPGGVLEVPMGVQPILIGDLHGKVDNLLTILSHNGFLKGLKKGTACLIFLGDAVHSEEPGEMEDMDSSILIMDLIFKLMLHFPDRVFYLMGNHDSFSEEIGKQGVPQGVIWEKTLLKTRGREYLKEIRRFYERQPLLVFSKHFVACHAAPPTSNISMGDLINVRSNPKLYRELTNNRIQRPNRPGGYSKKNVKRLRKSLDLPPEAPFIVGHTPMCPDETFWEISEIENHYVLYAGNRHRVAVMAEVCGRMHPFVYPVENLCALINTL